ncbi:YchJ family protein [Leucobacter coleopterorum]|uniref:YchJ family protein n=1 Tax=Leucobacter coleopterorum TaxID=2714933 RepID=UPI003137EBF8
MAPTAERLMRSRYSAFVLGLDSYLLRSWHSSTRPRSLQLDHQVEWRRLVIEQTTAGGPFDSDGEVTFTAVARTPDGRLEQRERSRFVRDEQGRWSYIDGVEL